MKPTKIIDRFGLSPARKNLADNVIAKFDIPDKGVVVIFERDDYINDNITIWGNSLALHLNIKHRIEEMSAEHLIRLMKSKDYDQLIWISKQVCESQDIDFAWVLSHELRHLEQDLQSNELSKATYFIRGVLGRLTIEEPKVFNTIPAELDANLKAWIVTRDILGKKIIDTYVENQSTAGEQKQNFTILRKYDPQANYDVIGRTVELMTKYKTELKAIQGRSRNNAIKDFDLDSSLVELENGPQDI